MRCVQSSRPEQQAVLSFLWFLLIGVIAGWLAGLLMKGRGFGWLVDMIVGVIGALIGGYVFGLLGVSIGGTLGELVSATVGAVIFLFLLKLLKKV
jgi:uncharacterized membrane protein YeaQ/YmgE (transglycosylase-associated protein family)